MKFIHLYHIQNYYRIQVSHKDVIRFRKRKHWPPMFQQSLVRTVICLDHVWLEKSTMLNTNTGELTLQTRVQAPSPLQPNPLFNSNLKLDWSSVFALTWPAFSGLNYALSQLLQASNEARFCKYSPARSRLSISGVSFKIKLCIFRILWSYKYFLIMQINNFRGDLSYIWAKTATLLFLFGWP